MHIVNRGMNFYCINMIVFFIRLLILKMILAHHIKLLIISWAAEFPFIFITSFLPAWHFRPTILEHSYTSLTIPPLDLEWSAQSKTFAFSTQVHC